VGILALIDLWGIENNTITKTNCIKEKMLFWFGEQLHFFQAQIMDGA
jgi:hypothetical protein